MLRADNRAVGQRIRHDRAGPRQEPDATSRALRVLVLSVLAESKPMTVAELWTAIGAPKDPEVLLRQVLDDLVERGEIEIRWWPTWQSAWPTRHYTLTASERADG